MFDQESENIMSSDEDLDKFHSISHKHINLWNIDEEEEL